MSNKGVSLGVCRIKWVTPKAIKVATKDYGELWIPQSAVHADSEIWDKVESEGNLVVCNWYAIKEKLI